MNCGWHRFSLIWFTMQLFVISWLNCMDVMGSHEVVNFIHKHKRTVRYLCSTRNFFNFFIIMFLCIMNCVLILPPELGNMEILVNFYVQKIKREKSFLEAQNQWKFCFLALNIWVKKLFFYCCKNHLYQLFVRRCLTIV